MKAVKKLFALFLCAALIVSFAQQTNAKAAVKTQKETLLVGEVVNYTPLLGTLKSASSSKKSVATVKKSAGKAVVTAKKAGTATITIKSTRGTNKIKLTIKKADFTCGLKVLPDGYVLLSVKNNTSVYVDSATIAYTLRTPEGETIAQSTRTVSDLMPKKTAYEKISYNDYSFTVSTENSSAAYAGGNRSLSAKYKSRVSTTKATVTDETDGKITLKVQNTYSGAVRGTIDVLYYDEQGNVIYYNYYYVSMKGNDIVSNTVNAPNNGYASYKLIVRTYSKTY